MLKVTKQRRIDPIAAAEQFKADMAKMAVDPKPAGGGHLSRLLDKNFGLEEHRYRTWSADLMAGQTLEQALDPTFWASQSERIMGHDALNPRGVGDTIILRQPSTALRADLQVNEVGKGFIKVDVIRLYDPPIVTVLAEWPLQPRWNEQTKKWDIIRVNDASLMRQGFQTAQSAAEWIEEHLKAMAA